MRLFKRKRYPWEEDEEENGIENPANWSVRQELERQFQNPIHDKPQTPNPFANIDTSNMSLRQELEAKFDALNDSSKTYPTQITPNLFEKNVIKDEQNDFTQEIITQEDQNPFFQVLGAIKDMSRNYFDMKEDKTKKADDYFHCKANFEAANRGKYGAKTAQWLGDRKEDFDYYYNQLWKGLTPEQAEEDKLHDKMINKIARQRAKKRLYSNSREACQPYRVRGVNAKY